MLTSKFLSSGLPHDSHPWAPHENNTPEVYYKDRHSDIDLYPSNFLAAMFSWPHQDLPMMPPNIFNSPTIFALFAIA
jgi:hypothetical protein